MASKNTNTVHPERVNALSTWIENLEDRLDEQNQEIVALQERVAELEAENERLRERVDNPGNGKESKVAAIVRFANNKRDGRPAAKLNAGEVKGAAGVSRRYAYDLMDRLPEQYDWFLTPEEMSQYGSIEIDNTDQRRLGIDFEGVHSEGCPVNKFTTADGSNHTE